MTEKSGNLKKKKRKEKFSQQIENDWLNKSDTQCPNQFKVITLIGPYFAVGSMVGVRLLSFFFFFLFEADLGSGLGD